MTPIWSSSLKMRPVLPLQRCQRVLAGGVRRNRLLLDARDYTHKGGKVE